MDYVDPIPSGANGDDELNIVHKSSKAHHFFFGNHSGEVDYETFYRTTNSRCGVEIKSLLHSSNDEIGGPFKQNFSEPKQRHVNRKDGFLWIILPYVIMAIMTCFVAILHDGGVSPQSSLLAHSSGRKHKTRKRVGRFWLLETNKANEPNNNTAVIARYNGPDPKEMNKEQQEIRDYILESRPTTGLSGPFGRK